VGVGVPRGLSVTRLKRLLLTGGVGGFAWIIYPSRTNRTLLRYKFYRGSKDLLECLASYLDLGGFAWLMI
jgi:predicted membrane-bound mannosyltransferase